MSNAPVLDISDAIAEAVEAALPAPADPAVDAAEGVDSASVPDAAAAGAESAAEAGSDVPDIGNLVDTEEASGEEGGTEDGAEEVSEDDVALPEGYVAVPVVDDQLATEFVLRDGEGEVEIPALIVEYKANGKVRQDRLDQVVKLAQFGVYNQEREAKAQEVERVAQRLQDEYEQAAQLLAERESQLERMLVDDDFFYAVREAYEAENSPERRAERAEQAIEDLRQQQVLSQIVQEGENFYGSQVQPAVDLIVKSLPSVTHEELFSRMAYAMQAHTERLPNGQVYIPSSRYAEVRKYIVEDLASWAQFQHAQRAGSQTQPAKKSADVIELDRARIEAQKAKRALGQALKPVGRAAKEPAATRRAPNPANLDEAVNSALDEVLSSLR